MPLFVIRQKKYQRGKKGEIRKEKEKGKFSPWNGIGEEKMDLKMRTRKLRVLKECILSGLLFVDGLKICFLLHSVSRLPSV